MNALGRHAVGLVEKSDAFPLINDLAHNDLAHNDLAHNDLAHVFGLKIN